MNIDSAMKWGFGWDIGPFELWDNMGVKKSVEKMKSDGYSIPKWVEEMLNSGVKSFYKYDKGKKLYYDINSKEHKEIPGTKGLIILDAFKATNTVWKKEGTTLYDIGDGVLNLEFHTKMNTMGAEVIEGINKAISIVEKTYKGLVIGNEGDNFSAGANLGMLFMFAVNRDYDKINVSVKTFQNTIMRARSSSVPVVVATSGLTLGGGPELAMHAACGRAHTET